MKTNKIIFITITLVILLGCISNSKQNQKINSTNEVDTNKEQNTSISYLSIQRIIKLKHDFEILVGKGEDFGDFITFLSFELSHKDKTIFIDTSQTEYEFGAKLYPIINSIDSETFELLVEINDRPNKNYLKYFKIRNDSLIEIKNLPTFISKASNLDNDKYMEYAGFWDYSQMWGTNDDTVAYNPIIYYEINENGIFLRYLANN